MDERKTDLVVVGMAYFEVFVPPHQRPPAGEELFVDGIQLALGGALNSATVAAALGLHVTLCVPLGQGIVDQAVVLLTKRLGIRLEPLAASDNPAISLVFSNSSDRSFVSTSDFEVLTKVKHLPTSRWVHVPGLEEAYRLKESLTQARRDGARISVSASWSPRQLSQLVERKSPAWDLLVLNENEALAACGDVATAPQRLAVAADSVLVTLAANGVCGVLDGTMLRVPALTAQVIDPTGAGDAFCGGLIAGMLRGATPKAAVQLGTRAAARILKQTGGLVNDPSIMADLTEGALCKS
ncbi:carbohydrate kinase family protein [Patescibacteria group bacterium]|nr:carbohydrate kinase family protein [Patescibacteria group bacterium]